MNPCAERVRIAGLAGAIEALIESPAAEQRAAFGVICHPHPLYGGSLDNKVVYILARAFQEAGLPTIRFNFRGVGASEGEFGHGIGETEDVLAVIASGRERWPGAALWLAGFSFGGAVAIRAAVQAKAACLVTVAPAVSPRVDLSGIELPQCPWLVVQGDADDVVEPASVLDWVKSLPRPPQVAVLAGAEHFFHGRLNELRAAVTGYLSQQKPG
jgi:alpha/beta superfamily hydrolase